MIVLARAGARHVGDIALVVRTGHQARHVEALAAYSRDDHERHVVMVRRPKGRTLGEVEIGARIKAQQILGAQDTKAPELLHSRIPHTRQGLQFH